MERASSPTLPREETRRSVLYASSPRQAGGGVILGDNRGWGFGLAVNTRRDGLSAVPDRSGWDGGDWNWWAADPQEDVVTVLMTQRLSDSANGPGIYFDFWTSVYQAIDD